MANSVIDACSGIGKRYVPSSVASVSLRKICSTWVVATCEEIFVSILIDLIGRLRGRVMGRGGRGQRSQGPGTITPCAAAVVTIENRTEIERSSNRSFRTFIFSSLVCAKVTHLLG